MRLLFLTGSLNQGGAEFQILALARLFKEKGHDVEVFALTDYSFYMPYLLEHNIRYSHLNNDQSKLKRLWLTAKKFREVSPDVVIAYLRIVGQLAVFSRLLSFRSFKVLIGERTSLIIPGYDTYYFNLMRLVSGITVNSISKYHYIKKVFPFLSAKTYFCPNIIDTKSFRPAGIKNDVAINISFIGRISPEKNLIELIKAIKLLIPDYPNLVLNIYGDARNAQYMKKVKEQVASYGTSSSHLNFRGKSGSMAEVYGKTHLLCLISDFEGFSNVIAEALCCGIPVVASDIEENRYLIEDGVNGFLVNQESIESIANGINRYLRLSEKDKVKMSSNGRAKAEKLFDSDKTYSEYISIINDSST